MMKNYSSLSSRFHYPFHKPKNINDHVHDYQHFSLENHKKTPLASNPIFNSINKDKGTLKKITKITFFSSSSLHNPNHDDNKFLPPIDCSKYLPPLSYNTKKRKPLNRRRRYMNTDDDDDVIAAQTLLHISRGGYDRSSANIDVNHRCAKRLKLSCTISDIDETLKDNSHNEKKLVLRFKIPKEKIFQTSQDCNELADNDIEEKKINEGEIKLGLKVEKNFDLNELPSIDLEDESN